MNERAASRRRWRVGELARATGLTVRTLHHYESLGLLVPSARTEGHQRVYDQQDLRRLYRIRALRDVGLSLAEIRELLEDDRAALCDVLRAHRARVDAELERLGRLRALLEHACAQADDAIEPDAVLATIEAMSRVTRRSDERSATGNAPEDAEARWRELGNALRACLLAGEPASAPRTRAVARACRARIVEFAGNDAATLEALAHLRRFAPPRSLAGWDPALMQYLERALASLDEMEVENAKRTDCEERGTGSSPARLGRAGRSEPPDGAARDGSGRAARQLAARVPGGARRARSSRGAVR